VYLSRLKAWECLNAGNARANRFVTMYEKINRQNKGLNGPVGALAQADGKSSACVVGDGNPSARACMNFAGGSRLKDVVSAVLGYPRSDAFAPAPACGVFSPAFVTFRLTEKKRKPAAAWNSKNS